VALSEAEVARLERLEAAPGAPGAPGAPPERIVLGADGAMVPLVGGEWAEVKLVSMGEPTWQGSELRTTRVSYFARLADAAAFERAALEELWRRGVFRAAAVAAVQDGAAWLQGFVDYHRPDAVRILDWAHAVEHLTALAEGLFGLATPRAGRVARRLRRWLWDQGPARLLAVLAGWLRARPDDAGLARAVTYFRERRAQLDYPAFRAAGWPVGSGATESGHKQVMQARMKRAGMRWARPHVNPVLALSLLVHNDRWAAEGPTLLAAHRARCAQAHRARQHVRRLAGHCLPQLCPFPVASSPPPVPVSPPCGSLPPPPVPLTSHPWRRYGAPLSVKI
jgi:hypothetical protein